MKQEEEGGEEGRFPKFFFPSYFVLIYVNIDSSCFVPSLPRRRF